MAEALIRTEDLKKTFRHGFLMRRVEAVKGVTFAVERGEFTDYNQSNIKVLAERVKTRGRKGLGGKGLKTGTK